jgi:hypothetical protein
MLLMRAVAVSAPEVRAKKLPATSAATVAGDAVAVVMFAEIMKVPFVSYEMACAWMKSVSSALVSRPSNGASTKTYGCSRSTRLL